MKMLNRFPQSYSVLRIPTWVAIWIITSLGALRTSRRKWDLHHFGLIIVEWETARAIKRILRKKFLYWEASLSGENYMDAVHDTRAALHFLAEQHIGSRIYIARLFIWRSCWYAGRCGKRNDSCVCLHFHAFGKYNLDFLAPCKKPKLIVYTRNDFATTEEDTLRCFSKILPPKQLELIQDSDHFYRKKEETVSKRCAFFSEHR